MQSEVVTRIRGAVAADPYSDDAGTPAVADLDITTLAPAEPRPSGEPVQDARNAITSGWTLYLPVGADVTGRDQMKVRGVVHDVLGDPADWLGVGVVVQCERTEG